MMNLRRAVSTAAAASILGIALPTVSPAQRPGAIAGRVLDSATRAPLASAQIVITAAARFTTTTPEGSFALEGVPGGEHVLEIRRIGYAPRRATVQVASGARARIEVAMVAVPAELPSITVEADRGYLGGFWERRRENVGHFITRDDIERRRPHRIADLFSGVTGAKIVPTSAHGVAIASNRGARTFNSREECIAAVFVNGAPFQLSPAGLNEFPPDNIEAVEYYSSVARIPSRFNVTGSGSGSPRCGVVAIWLRNRR